MIRPLCAEQNCKLFPRAVHRARCRKALFMCSAGAVTERLHGLHDSVEHLLRFFQRRRRIIQIDHGLMMCAALSSFSTISYMLVTAPTANLSVSP